MTRKSSSKANGDGRSKAPKETCQEPPLERFRSLEELKKEFVPHRRVDCGPSCGPSACGFRSLRELTRDFEQQVGPAKETARKSQQPPPREVEPTPPMAASTGVLKKIFEGRGFGFIAPDQDHGAGDVFLHFSDISGGGARSLGVGARVRYDVEPDAASGRLRAKNVSVLPSSAAPEASGADQGSEGAPCIRPAMSRAYNRDIMLGIYKALLATPRSMSSRCPTLKITTVAIPRVADADEEDPHLDDERLLARLEERLDKETGADALNWETFGATSGWTYEEALAANAKLQAPPELEESTVGGASSEPGSVEEAFTRAPTEGSVDSEAGEDARAALGDAEARCADGRWSWEFATSQAKILEGNRHVWEVEHYHTPQDAAPMQVFQ